MVVTQRKTCSSWRSIYFPVNSYHSCYPTMKLVLAIEYPSLSTLIIVVTQLEEYRTRNGSCQKVNSYHSCYLTAISLCMHSFLVLQKPIKGGANLIQVGFYTYICFTFLLFHQITFEPFAGKNQCRRQALSSTLLVQRIKPVFSREFVNVRYRSVPPLIL